jgi:hypothetical protein
MISRGMDVIELLNSELLYPSIWTNISYFSTTQKVVVVPYNRDVEDLNFERPDSFFEDNNDHHDHHHHKESKEKFEMDFKYIYMHKIQGVDKIEFTRTLSNCEDV